MIKFKTIYILFSLLLLCLIFNSCTEPYILETNTYEEALIVEATITNELKKQEITLTKSSRFEDKETKAESGANVFITDNAGNQYDFEEEDGKYISTLEFQAVPGREYRLNINTLDGRTFESSIEKLTNINPMQSVTATVEPKDSLRGVAIRVNSFDPNNQSKYYRYEYEETYKIVAPKWVDTKAVLNNNGSISFVPNRTDIRICYSSKKSTEMLLENTNILNEDRVNFLVRFISDQNYIITTRYSILVKQYVESLAAFNYYKTLKKISDSGSLLSPNQPGILLGNIKAVSNPNSKVIGYFDVASVSTERIYFNYNDLFPNEPAPPYYTDCVEFCYANCEIYAGQCPCTHDTKPGVQEDLAIDSVRYFLQSERTFWVNTPCSDCTTFSSNIKPPFWID
ncbi:DUF4249 domain-containing protein [Flavobacterium sp. M31R6]|uniref:DUF4249 domain-containing protein n=1 Tax=Flavobacterium sp. M31R6 TaxID=2739062 RepID=UPI00156A3817|nr:DUF4249 domain-containing protein [Flavobacterium sp. M31R6]QKJ62638.1 DUF4249 domain-containing protein [Flavobacterium sp. M31R6]